ncbi:hypothetical protein ABID42_002855 [Arcicella rosea]|uniref:hypothetical protein n=1 Tax=Arcicella rosea TaxID=502909 RepID=UPI00345CDE4B
MLALKVENQALNGLDGGLVFFILFKISILCSYFNRESEIFNIKHQFKALNYLIVDLSIIKSNM